jgi:hypothetical protein
MRLFCSYVRGAGMRLVIHVSVLLMVGIASDAMAEPGKQHLHARHFLSHVHQGAAAKTPSSTWPQAVRLGALRYYGGPKSPMWRGSVEN